MTTPFAGSKRYILVGFIASVVLTGCGSGGGGTTVTSSKSSISTASVASSVVSAVSSSMAISSLSAAASSSRASSIISSVVSSSLSSNRAISSSTAASTSSAISSVNNSAIVVTSSVQASSIAAISSTGVSSSSRGASSSVVISSSSTPKSSSSAISSSSVPVSSSVAVSSSSVPVSSSVADSSSSVPVSSSVAVSSSSVPVSSSSAASSSAATTVLPIKSGLLIHLDASKLVADDSSAIASWDSVDTATLSAVQMTTSLMPALQKNALNGNAVVHFDGIDDRMKFATNIFSDPSSARTIFAVIDTNDYNAHLFGVGNGSESQLANDGFALGLVSEKAFFKAKSDSAGAWLIAPNLSMQMGSSILAVRANSAGQELVTPCHVAKNTTAPVASINSTLWLGGANNGAGSFDGDIAEIIVYDRVLTDQEFAQVRSYLATRYGIYIASTVDTNANGVLDGCDSSSSYLPASAITLSLLPPTVLAGGTLANLTDVASPFAFDPHTQESHIWVRSGSLKVRYEFAGIYNIEQLHFWNYTAEDFDADTIVATFYGSSNEVVKTVTLKNPALGFGDVLAQDFAINATHVKAVVLELSGSNGNAEAMNLGFSGSLIP